MRRQAGPGGSLGDALERNQTGEEVMGDGGGSVP